MSHRSSTEYGRRRASIASAPRLNSHTLHTTTLIFAVCRLPCMIGGKIACPRVARSAAPQTPAMTSVGTTTVAGRLEAAAPSPVPQAA